MKTLKVWKLEAVTETGPYGLVARFATRQAAEDAKSCAGGYGPHVTEETIKIFESAVEYNPRLNHAAVMSGLAKLTNEEKKALGVDGIVV